MKTTSTQVADAIRVLSDDTNPLWQTIIQRLNLKNDVHPFISNTFFNDDAFQSKAQILSAVEQLRTAGRIREVYTALALRLEKLQSYCQIVEPCEPAWFFYERHRQVTMILCEAIARDGVSEFMADLRRDLVNFHNEKSLNIELVKADLDAAAQTPALATTPTTDAPKASNAAMPTLADAPTQNYLPTDADCEMLTVLFKNPKGLTGGEVVIKGVMAVSTVRDCARRLQINKIIENRRRRGGYVLLDKAFTLPIIERLQAEQKQ
jgi:hypothetical protein